MQPEDVPAADAAGWAGLRPLYPPDEPPDEERRRRAQRRIAHCQRTDPDGAWVAEADGEIVGLALAIVREGMWGLSLLSVRPEHQSQGVGRKLLEASLRIAEGCKGALILSSEDPKAMRRYARAGFDLRPCVALAGIPDRSAIPAGLRSRPGSAVEDRELCDAASRAVRGAAHGPDVEAIERNGGRLLVHDAGGWAALRDSNLVLLAARDEAIARDLLWSALASLGPGETFDADFITAGQDWAIQVGLEARLALSPYGPVFTRGDVGPFRPYLPSGAYL